MPLPRLLPVTRTGDLPNIKITQSGITILHQCGAKSRYGGSSGHAVDLSGVLWENKKEMVKVIYPERKSKDKKNAPAATDANKVNHSEDEYIDFYEELPTHERLFLTNLEKLYTYEDEVIPKIKRTYTVKKTEIRQRILSHIAAKRRSFAELYFWTITFPGGSSDDIIYQIFNTWLTTLRKKDKYGRRFLRDYLWIAERQTGERLTDKTKTPTGTIHFHIAIPHKMPVHHANRIMQTILAYHAKRKEVPFTRQQCNKYNGIHLAKDKNKRVINFASRKGSRAITGYLTKYLTKNNERFPHLAWHNSRGFSNMFTAFYTTRKHFYAMGVRRKDAWGEWKTVPWFECLEEDKNKWFPKRGDLEDKEEDERRKANGTDFFQFIPWGHLGMPENIALHMAELNGYCIDNFRQKQLN